MASIITLKGIDQGISNLNCRNKNALKYRLVNIVRQFYENESSVESIQGIESDELVKVLWDTGDDPATIKKKRKNLSNIKSSINANLKKLYEEGKNPDGIIIGPANIFVMSDEAKDKVLKSFKNRVADEGTATLGQIADILNIVNEILSKPEAFEDTESGESLRKSDQLKNLIRGLSEKVGLDGPKTIDSATEGSMTIPGEKVTIVGPDAAEVTEDYEDIEEIAKDDEIVEDAEIFDEIVPEEEVVPDEPQEVEDTEDLDEDEVIEDLEDVEIDDTIEEAEHEEDLEQVEIDDDLEDLKVDDISEEAKDDLKENEIEEDLEDVEVIDSLEEDEEVEAEDDLEEVDEVEEVEEAEEADLLADNLGEKYSDGGYGEDDEIRKAILLAEEFNNLLGVIDRYYNQYVLIPEGEYIVGSKRPKKDEKPEQLVHLSQFYMGKFPVTNALFEIFVDKTGYRTTAEKLGYGTVYYGRSRKTIDKKTGLKRFIWNSALITKTVKGACWYQPLGPGSTLYNKKNHPVVHVSLEDAIAFAAWTGKRLPTEDEWEGASRTANGYVFPCGNDWKKDSCNIEESSIGDTAPVDKYIKLANDFGIVDTIGNVLEWTSDTSKSPSHLKNRSKYYIVKGGSWISGNDIRLFSRFKLDPESHSNILGFRCVAY